MKNKIRCGWCESSDLMRDYHDNEWGTPIHNDKKLFEFLILDAFQAGLSWSTILNKRNNFAKAFDNFDYKKVAKYDEYDYKRLINDAGIIRNRLKIRATINNAQKFLEIQKGFGSFDKYIWYFVNYEPINNNFKDMKQIPAKTELSDKMSKDLLKRGFKFVGSTICYSFMQAAGLVNDHVIDCYRFEEITK